MINRHADVPAIALYALGPYRSELKRSQQRHFFRGVGMFIARYFADQAAGLFRSPRPRSARRSGPTPTRCWSTAP
jgi:hypothetical protein